MGKREMKRKVGSSKKTRWILFVFSVLGICLVLVFLGIGVYMSRSYIAKVNEEAVSYAEFKQQISLNRANVLNYFNQKYGVQDSKSFWTSSFGGEVPLEVLKQKALNECVKIKLQEILAREKGVITDVSYDSFLEGLKAENAKRSNAAKNHEPVYGPLRLDENGYLNYFLGNMIMKLKEKLAENELKASEDELQSYYRSVKDKLYKYEDTVRISVIKLAFGADGKKVNTEEKKQKLKEIQAIEDRLKNGEDFDQVIKDAVEGGIKGLSKVDRTLDKDTARNDFKTEPVLMDAIKNIMPGGISGMFEENSAFIIVKCLDRKGGGYKNFDEIKGSVASAYVNMKYDELIEGLIKDANVKVNDMAYKKFK